MSQDQSQAPSSFDPAIFANSTFEVSSTEISSTEFVLPATPVSQGTPQAESASGASVDQCTGGSVRQGDQPTPELTPGAKPQKAPIPDNPTFRDLPLSDEVQQAVKLAGYDKPTPIQTQIIPHVLEGRDVLAQSQTGSGKTAAFALPILSRIESSNRVGGGNRQPRVLVLTPTRELAMQVAKSFDTYAACLPGFAVAAIYGGQDYGIQLRQLKRGVHVVVGTPGRVIDHIKRGTLDLSTLECLVLDEADEMLNMGFLDDVKFVLDQTPDTRQIALFSATLPAPIRTIAQRYLNDPAKITIQNRTMTVDSVRQRALFVAPRDRIDALKRILEAEESDGVIVFTKTRESTLSVAEQLTREGLSAVALNGDMPQRTRERTIQQLKAGELDILVATDVAARGLDVTRVSHVFNYDLPHDTESYIHRIGRTGRAGRKGEAVIFLTKGQRGRLRTIENLTKQPIEIAYPPTADEINAMRVKRFKQRIADTIDGGDLSLFADMISDHAEETGRPMAMIAAALAQIGQQGRPFFMQERPRPKRQDRDDRHGDRNGRDRFERHSSGDRSQRTTRGDARPSGATEEGMDRYRIEVGRKDGVKPGNIVGAVANEGGIDSEYIGAIRIHDSFSTIDLPEGMPRDVFQALQTTWVSGKQLRLTRATEADSVAGDFRGRDNRAHKSGGPKRKGPGRFTAGKAPHGKKRFKKRNDSVGS